MAAHTRYNGLSFSNYVSLLDYEEIRAADGSALTIGFSDDEADRPDIVLDPAAGDPPRQLGDWQGVEAYIRCIAGTASPTAIHRPQDLTGFPSGFGGKMNEAHAPYRSPNATEILTEHSPWACTNRRQYASAG